MTEKVFRDTRYGRFNADAKLNKPPPVSQQRLSATSVPGPRAAADQVNVLSGDHPRFPYHSRQGRLSDPGKVTDYEMKAQPNHVATNAGAPGGAAPPHGSTGLSIALAFPRSFTRASAGGTLPAVHCLPGWIHRAPYLTPAAMHLMQASSCRRASSPHGASRIRRGGMMLTHIGQHRHSPPGSAQPHAWRAQGVA
jgi:hypothetical protein